MLLGAETEKGQIVAARLFALPREEVGQQGGTGLRRRGVALGQQDSNGVTGASNDGMDAGFIWYERASATLHYAGARLALYLLAPDTAAVQSIDGDRMGVGYTDTPADYQWHKLSIPLAPGSLVLITTDGLIDQIGGSREIAYGKRRMRDAMLAQRHATAAQAGAALLADFLAWQGEQPRRDDLTFFCFRT